MSHRLSVRRRTGGRFAAVAAMAVSAGLVLAACGGTPGGTGGGTATGGTGGNVGESAACGEPPITPADFRDGADEGKAHHRRHLALFPASRTRFETERLGRAGIRHPARSRRLAPALLAHRAGFNLKGFEDAFPQY